MEASLPTVQSNDVLALPPTKLNAIVVPAECRPDAPSDAPAWPDSQECGWVGVWASGRVGVGSAKPQQTWKSIAEIGRNRNKLGRVRPNLVELAPKHAQKLPERETDTANIGRVGVMF